MRTPTYNLSNLWKHTLLLTLLVSGLLGTTLSASAAPLSFSINGTNAATGTSLVGWANFVFNETTRQLTIQVINGSGNATANSDVLTAIFWQRGNTSSVLTPTSAAVTGSSITWNQSNGQQIGSYWQFASGIAGPDSTNEGISSNPFGIFGKGNFSTTSASLGNLNGGIVNGIDPSVSGSLKNAFIVQNEVTYTLNTGSNFSLSDFQNVYFQFGTSLSGPRLLAKLAVPEPGTVAMLASMGASSLLVGVRRYRRRRRA